MSLHIRGQSSLTAFTGSMAVDADADLLSLNRPD